MAGKAGKPTGEDEHAALLATLQQRFEQHQASNVALRRTSAVT
ncbi:hypothetical protein [Aquincola tertiaricarbonis]|nr:hypothetical protein [Aquincola tertiaricarbonis]